MCGRFTLTLDADEIRTALRLGQIPAEWQPRRNIAPTEPVAVVVDAVQRDVLWMRWGLIPSWAKDMSIGSRMF
ncbi:MAG TPA: SOS response-associated peptidase family protein, partial [Anaerolineaceae bacterium]|nr:SOS response-associated peptidase family protein [Anaerolineaceae bacterium]